MKPPRDCPASSPPGLATHECEPTRAKLCPSVPGRGWRSHGAGRNSRSNRQAPRWPLSPSRRLELGTEMKAAQHYSAAMKAQSALLERRQGDGQIPPDYEGRCILIRAPNGARVFPWKGPLCSARGFLFLGAKTTASSLTTSPSRRIACPRSGHQIVRRRSDAKRPRRGTFGVDAGSWTDGDLARSRRIAHHESPNCSRAEPRWSRAISADSNRARRSVSGSNRIWCCSPRASSGVRLLPFEISTTAAVRGQFRRLDRRSAPEAAAVSRPVL